MKTYSITDTGILREMNQDYFFASDEPVGNLPNLYIVADGMGTQGRRLRIALHNAAHRCIRVPEFGRRTSYNFKRGNNNCKQTSDHRSCRR